MADSTDPATVDEIREKSDTIIVTAYNDRDDITGEIHTEKGKYTLHNVYAYDKSRHSYAAKGGYGTLQEAVGHMSLAPAG